VNVVAILGRPNVGKSSLFNRFLKKRRALVDRTPGVTRDRLYGEVEWRGLRFQIIDTGGLQLLGRDGLAQGIAAQVNRAMEEATLALVVCDLHDGPVPLDREMAQWVRRWGKPTLLVVNKVDNPKDALGVPEFSALGLGQPHPVSALHGLGIGDLLDEIVRRLREAAQLPVPPSPLEGESRGEGAASSLTVAIIGRPNVGKSSLLNRLLGSERVLVDAAPGTTRDPVEVNFEYKGRSYRLIDTAGVRARRKLDSQLEAAARLRALKVIRQADVCLGVLEGPTGIVQDDLKLLDQVVTWGKPLCLLVNKWDLLPGVDPTEAAAQIGRRAPFLRFASVICTSAKSGWNVLKALEQVGRVAEEAKKRITSVQAQRLLETVRTDPHAPVGIRNSHLFRLFQVGVSPPTFHLLGRVKRRWRSSEVAYLEKILRREVGFSGVPIRIHLLTGNSQ
jgi:GTP-binding protein